MKIADTIKDIKVGSSDTKINKIADFQKITSENKGKEITLTIDRNGKDFDVNLTPRINPPAGQGAVGVGLERMATLIKKYPWYDSSNSGSNLYLADNSKRVEWVICCFCKFD